MKFIILLAVLGIVCAELSQEEVKRYFEAFKVKFGRNYDSQLMEDLRQMIFEQNLNVIIAHNLEADNGRKNFRLGVNNFTDMTNSEFRAFYNGLRLDRRVPRKSVEIFNPEGIEVPSKVDWRTKGVVTPIKNQQQCGSCWAFSAVASIEGQHALKNKKLVSLSEQNLVDCSSAEGNYGCEGGLMDQAFQYVIQNKGIDTEASYSYKAIDESCEFNKKNVGATVMSYTDIPTGDEKALAAAVASVGPISVAIDASQTSFQLYASGVYDEPNCSTQQLDHGVTAVGYGTQAGKDYWLVKNSWGTTWGEKGYILMSRNDANQCGIATMSSYPKV